MTEFLLCLTAICMVLWIMLLMAENSRLKRELAELKRTLRDKLDKATGSVEVREGRRLTSSEVRRVDHDVLRKP